MEVLKAKFDGPAAPQLLCFLVFRFSKIFVKLGRKHDAQEACEFALRNFNGGRSDMHNLILATKLLLIAIRGFVRELDWDNLRQDFIRTDDHSKTLLLTGFIRESGHLNNPKLDLKIDAEDILTVRLEREEEINNCAAKKATIRLTLAIYRYMKEFTFDRKACLGLLERAITDFKRAECRCEPHLMVTDYYDELFEAADCPCHLLLADALLLQGIVQSQLRLCDEAQASFEEGLVLVGRHSKYRQYLFRRSLIALHPVEFPPHVGSDTVLSEPVINQVEHVSLLRHPLSDVIGECSMSSPAQVGLLDETLEASSEIVDGFTTGRLLDLFLAVAMERFSRHAIMVYAAIKTFPEVSGILDAAPKSCCAPHAAIEVATRCFMKIICGAAEKSGKFENIAMYVERVVEDLKQLHKEVSDDFDTRLQAFLMLRCAKHLLRFGLKYKELGFRVCESAMSIINNHPDMVELIISISYIFAKLHDVDGGGMSWKEFTNFDALIEDALSDRSDTQCLSETATYILTGFLRETKDFSAPVLRLENVKGILNKSLRRDSETNNDVSKQATIRLTLAIYFLEEKSTPSLLLEGKTLLKEAISGLRRALCMCPRYSMRSDYYDEVFGATECPRHVLLADALMYEGIVLSMDSLMVRAKKSFDEGSRLVECYCNDDVDRQLKFNLRLSELQRSLNPTSFKYGPGGFFLSRLNAPGHPTLDIINTTEEQYLRKVADDMGLLQEDAICRIVQAGGDVQENMKEFLSSKTRVQEYVQRVTSRGDYLEVVGVHSGLSLLSGLYEGCEAVAKEHLCLAVEALDRLSEDFEPFASCNVVNWKYRQKYLDQLMETGHLAVIHWQMDRAYKLYYKAYQLTQRKFDDLAQSSTEENIIHFFETSKHVCVALANCEFVRASQLQDIRERILAGYRSLMWAERGKGGMLSRLFKHERLQVETNCARPSGTNDVDDNAESVFMTHDEHALMVLRSTSNSTNAKKTVFVEYAFVNQIALLIFVILDGGAAAVARINLLEKVDPETQAEAEKELQQAEKLLKKQKSSSPNTETDSEAWNQLFMKHSTMLKGKSSKANGELSKVLSALYASEVNRAPFNRWIPGMVAGIQRRAEEAQRKRMIGRDYENVEKEIKRLLQKLHAVLIKPIEETLHDLFDDWNPKGDNAIVFAPHEDLGVVPFGALHEVNSPYLIEQYVLSVSPSIRCFKQMESTYELKDIVLRQGEPSYLAEAGPPVLVGKRDGYPDSFGSLKEAHKEVDLVGRGFEPTACLKLVDDESVPDTRTCMKERVISVLPKASWVHLSVHGEISSQFPQGSLVFGVGDDQRLGAAEIIDSALHSILWRARCVIVSACQSGLGSVAGGGIMGFARAFMLAGVPSCVLSMWEVNQTFCTTFMEKLYVELRAGNDIGDAVQRTTSSMIREFKKPSEAQIPAQRRAKRFSRHEPAEEPAEVGIPECVLKWSILDWAAFSCFGFPGVKLPNAVTAIGTST